MTTPNQGKPAGAFTIGGGSGGGKWGEAWNEAGILQMLGFKTVNSWTGARQQYEATAIDPANAMRADIQALIDDVNLLNGVPAYGAAYLTWNMWTNFKRPLLPFNGQIGPTKRVDLIHPGSKTDGGLVGYDPGLWEVSLVVGNDGSVVPFAATYQVDLEVTVWDTPTHVAFKYVVEHHQDDQGKSSIAFTYPFVIPDNVSRFDVKVYAEAGLGQRKFIGGVKRSCMWLRRISEDSGSRPPDTVPDGNTQEDN